MKAWYVYLLTAVVLSMSPTQAPAGDEPPLDGVHGFLRKFCVECHAAGAAKGGFSIESLLGPARKGVGAANLRTYERIFRQLSKNKMPPKDADQPPSMDLRSAIDALKSYLDTTVDDRGARSAGAFARRLNREELQNDLFDTLGIDRTLYGLQTFAEQLPEEGRTDGFDTVGHGLGQSSLLLGQYQQFVDQYLALASDDFPTPKRWRFKFGNRYLSEAKSEFEGLGHRVFAFKSKNKDGEPNHSIPAFDLTWQLEKQSRSPQKSADDVEAAFASFFPNAWVNKRRGQLELERRGGLPFVEEDSLTIYNRMGMIMRSPPLSVGTTGRYKVRMRGRLRFTEGVEPVPVRVRYFNRSHHFSGRFDPRDLEDEPTYRFDEDQPRPCFENPDRFFEMKPGEWMVLEFDDFRSTSEVYESVRSGFTFDFRFESKARPKGRTAPGGVPAKVGEPGAIPTLKELEAYYPFLVEVDYLEVEGPYPLVDDPSALIPSRPTKGLTARATAQEYLTRILNRLYRGTSEPSDVDLLLGIFDRNFSRTKDFGGSLRTAICAAYLSPKHLFVSNATAQRKPGTPLTAHELATRLSLFLWSSTPDAELRSAAERGELPEAAVLKRQVDRLLRHPYSSELGANFAFQWLHLYNIGLNEPDPDLYSYDKQLEQAMVNETLRFFHEIVRTDGSIRLFLDSDWILMNDRLAEWYKFKFSGQEERRSFSSWRKVPVTALPKPVGVRGGLLGQPSILKLTSGSIRPSIVGRGMFILENILDDPPPPPPENVGEIANAVAGLDQKSVREQLEIHRKRASCNACHQRIDPLGFALENYGAIGQWRMTETDGMKPIVVEDPDPLQKGKTKRIERKGHPVDTKGVVMGTPVNGPRELRELLLTKDAVFARCLVSKLMIYGLGRSLRHQDQAVIDNIVAAAAKNNYRLREIIELIVLSDSFRNY